jgi:large subunit ribosomal protein L6
MSRVGLKTIQLPASVKLSIESQFALLEGAKGKMTVPLHEGITLKQEGSDLHVVRKDDSSKQKALHGTTRALMANAVKGVTEGFKEELELVGIGFRSVVTNNVLTLTVGFSHVVVIEPLPGVKITVTDNTKIAVEGVDKQAVGQVAASIRAVRKPEPYQGKGIRYKGERIIRKEGKRAATGSGNK